jgi:predicted unusual protein kinase regulating ubiquinone biosynthesis (AarF/ABC1/UbiB family)
VSDPPGGERPAGDAQDRPAGGRLRRTARLAALPAAHAGRAAVGLGRRLGGAPAEAVTAQVQARTAEQLFRTLGELKGGAMKVGQAMSAMEAALPAELAKPYREALVRLQDAAPPMPAGVVHRVLDQSFPAGWRHLFTSFDDRPVAAASIGQVHRAVWQDGSAVAVKVQYPGAAQALVADLGTLDTLAPLVRLAAPGLDPRALFAALRDRLAEEVDYVLEADAQTAFAEAFAGDPDIAVPQVLVVEDRVLVTEWMDGTPVSRVIADGSRADRDRCGLLLLRLLLSSPRRVGRLHGDPHPGNFRLLPDGRLGVLDFGSTEAVPTGWPARLGGLLTALRDEDAEALHGVASAAGLVRGDEVDAAALLALLGPYGEPLRTPRYRFERSWLQGQVRRTSDPRSPAARAQRHLSVPTRHLLLQRVAVGLAGVLTLLEADVAVDAEVRREVAGYA